MSDLAGTGHAGLMDRIYRYQRHVYDVTRKYYLLGRDHMIAGLAAERPGTTVLEIGCGTGRNLISAARRFPQAQFFGLDISRAMLESAEASIARAGLGQRVRLVHADATNFDPHALFGRDGFDRIFISYSVSMIPVWREAIRHAAACLSPGGSLHIVDFGDQAGLPRWFRAILLRWLALFHVTPRQDLFAVCEEVAENIGGIAWREHLFRGYAWHAGIRRQFVSN